jgi:hypothetical protein
MAREKCRDGRYAARTCDECCVTNHTLTGGYHTLIGGYCTRTGNTPPAREGAGCVSVDGIDAWPAITGIAGPVSDSSTPLVPPLSHCVSVLFGDAPDVERLQSGHYPTC